MNLLAFCFPLVLFVYWGILGYATLSVLRTQRHTLQNMLLAPAVGIAVSLLPLFWLARAGLPVEQFARPLIMILLFASLSIFWLKKPIFPIKKYLPFFGILILALFLTGRPLLLLGFSWLSYGNDDMTNYCLRALRFLHQGYTQTPDLTHLLSNRDYSLYYWFYDMPDMARTGSDLILACVSRLTNLMPIQIFMPVILGLHLCLISASGALMLQSRRCLIPSLLTCLLLACSPLLSLGALYQLIAQVGGITLLIAGGTILLQPFTIHQKYIIFKSGALISIILSSLMIYYPEVLPFLFLSVILYFSIAFLSKWKPNKNFLLTALCTLFFLLILLNIYWINVLSFIILQITNARASLFNHLFPYFLIPSGISDLWGLQPIAVNVREPIQSLLIIGGIILLISSIIFAIKQMFAKIPVIIMMMIFLITLVALFIVENGFGIFKTAMYMQPFLLGGLVTGILIYIPHKKIKIAFFTLFILTLLIVQHDYVKHSYGNVGSNFVELSNASKTDFLTEVKQLNTQIPKLTPVYIDTPSIVSAKIIALYFKDRPTTFYSKPFFDGFMSNPLQRKDNFFLSYFMPNVRETADQIFYAVKKNRTNYYFMIDHLRHPPLIDTFTRESEMITNGSVLVISTPVRSIFNRRKFSDITKTNFITLPWEKASNYLIFINSKLGQDYYLGENKLISLNNLESDYFYPHKSVAGIGRYLLLQIVNPSPKVRLAFSFTQTFTTNKPNILPSASVLGVNKIPLPLIGRGSARIFSPVIKPNYINHIPYIMLDMGRDGTSYPVPRMGIMKLYGSHIPLDPRFIVAHSRDISIISEDEYTHLKPPSMLNKFPDDLANPDVEYSGTYEDGWISEASFFNLTQPSNKAKVVITGDIPLIHDDAFSTELTIYIDGKCVTTKKLTLGSFDIEVPVSTKKGRRRLELHFTKTQSLPAGDDRTVAALIHSIGFKNV